MPDKPLLSPLISRALTLALFALMFASAARFARLLFSQPIVTLTDFDAFHLAGRMVWEGAIEQAYQWTAFFEREKDLGKQVFMPWTYPPPFSLLVAAVALFPLPIAYLLFIGPTLVSYLLILRHLAGPHLPFALAAASPAIIMAVRCGQNGLLTASLLGLLAMGLLGQKRWAGAPLGLMILKPHLAITLALATLLQKRWQVLVLAALTSTTVIALCTALLGPGVWTAFFHATWEAKIFLTEGFYPLFRMVSVYAGIRSIDIPTGVAFAAQFSVTIIILAVVTWAALTSFSLRTNLGLSALTAPFITPYAYDYDLCLLGIAMALLAPTFAQLFSERQQYIILSLSILGSSAGLIQNMRNELTEDTGIVRVIGDPILASVGVWPLLAMVGFIVFTLWKQRLSLAPDCHGAPVASPSRC